MSDKRRKALTTPCLYEIAAFFEEKAPSATAANWDNVGVLIGDSESKITGAVICDDLTEESIAVARKLRYSLIVNHHPCIFPRSKGISRLTNSGSSALVFEAARKGIAVLASHTNFDQCALEVPFAVSRALGFAPEGRLFDHESGNLIKLVTFVPKTHLDTVRTAICLAGAGQIGNYDSCTFGVEGEGSFRGLDGSNPFLGSEGELEKVREIRLETIFPRGLKKKILSALRKAHPYEEVAYDLYSVEQAPTGVGLVSGLGYGVYGSLRKKTPVKAILEKAEKAFRTQGALVTSASRTATKVAFVAGKGSAFMGDALSKGCDLFITGEAGYHDARIAAQAGMTVIELGHRESEYFFLRTVEGWLKELGLKTRVINTPIQTYS